MLNIAFKPVSILRRVLRTITRRKTPFMGSEKYWIDRYRAGGDSGSGSYGQLARFKAEVINAFVVEHDIRTVIEHGCGDGNQLALATYPSYCGFDISPKAIELCRARFRSNHGKQFRLTSDYKGETAELGLSLDVIYHLVEDETYNAYMERLFRSSLRFVIIYSSDFEEAQQYHERRRQFTRWIREKAAHWSLIRHVPNRFPYNPKVRHTSLSDFYIYQKTS